MSKYIIKVKKILILISFTKLNKYEYIFILEILKTLNKYNPKIENIIPITIMYKFFKNNKKITQIYF